MKTENRDGTERETLCRREQRTRRQEVKKVNQPSFFRLWPTLFLVFFGDDKMWDKRLRLVRD